jgi:glycosyltransferase involved in cell wall biosynthesis
MWHYLHHDLHGRPFDLVHVDTLGLVPYVHALGNIPVVLNHHNVESQMMARRAERDRSWVRRQYFRREAGKLTRMERAVCPDVTLNLVVSALDADRLRGVSPGSRVRVVSNGVDTEYFRPRAGAQSRRFSLIFVGGMNWYPNRDAVLYFLKEVWPLLREEQPERTLTVVGQDPPPELTSAMRDPRVHAPGFVDDVRPYLDSAETYVCPIRDGGGTRLKILDALSMGKPLVATGVAVEGLGLSEGIHFLRAESPEDYVRALRRLNEPGLRQRLAAAGRAFVESRYRWEVIGKDLLEAYDSALQS